jgi:uncharacterized protein
LSAEIVDATVLAARGTTIDREFLLIDLPRLTESAVSNFEKAQLSARFHSIEERVAIAGSARAKVRLVCQRCLGPVVLPVDDEFHVVLIRSEEELDQLPEQQDAIVADAARLDLVWLLEEQLLLAMPLVPTHGSADECFHEETRADGGDKDASEAGTIAGPNGLEAVDTQRPFAHLRDLLSSSAKKPKR